MISEKLSPNGRAICQVSFKDRYDIGMRSIAFKIDTGADVSTLSKSNLHTLGYDDEWIKANITATSQTISVASGVKANFCYVRLPLLNFYGYEAIDWPFAVLLGKLDYRPLLGLDLLGGFNFNLDNDNDCFTLKRTRAFKRRRPFLPNQEIHAIHSGYPGLDEARGNI